MIKKGIKKFLTGLVFTPCMFMLFACNDPKPNTPPTTPPANNEQEEQNQQPQVLNQTHYKKVFTALGEKLSKASFTIKSPSESTNETQGVPHVLGLRLASEDSNELVLVPTEVKNGYKVPNSAEDVEYFNSVTEITNFITAIFSSNKLNDLDLSKIITYKTNLFDSPFIVTQKLVYDRNNKTISGSFTFTEDTANEQTQAETPTTAQENYIVSEFKITYDFAQSKLTSYDLTTNYNFGEEDSSVGGISYEEGMPQVILNSNDNKATELITQIKTNSQQLVTQAKDIQNSAQQQSDTFVKTTKSFTEEYTNIKPVITDNQFLSQILTDVAGKMLGPIQINPDSGNQGGNTGNNPSGEQNSGGESQENSQNNVMTTNSENSEQTEDFYVTVTEDNAQSMMGTTAMSQTTLMMTSLLLLTQDTTTNNYIYDTTIYMNRLIHAKLDMAEVQGVEENIMDLRFQFNNDGKCISGYMVLEGKLDAGAENPTITTTVLTFKVDYEISTDNETNGMPIVKKCEVAGWHSKGNDVFEEIYENSGATEQLKVLCVKEERPSSQIENPAVTKRVNEITAMASEILDEKPDVVFEQVIKADPSAFWSPEGPTPENPNQQGPSQEENPSQESASSNN